MANNDGLAAFEARQIIGKAMAALSPKLRDAVRLHYLEGQACRDIAKNLGVPVGTVKRRLHDGRRKLKEEVEKMSNKNLLPKHAVGLETTGGQHTPIFARGLHLPASWSTIFSTAEDGQQQIVIHVMQGDGAAAADCRSVAALKISGWGKGQKKQGPQIRVTFNIDPKGAFSCAATQGSGQNLHVEGTPSRIEVEALGG